MSLEPLFELIRERFSPSEGKTVLTALKQDPLVWQFVSKGADSHAYFDTFASDVSAFSPGRIAAWVVEQKMGVTLGDLTNLETVLPDDVKLSGRNMFEATFNSGLAPIDLYSAGLLALTLRERRKIKGNWQGTANEILFKQGPSSIEKNVRIWGSPLACLISFIPDIDDLWLDFFQTNTGTKAVIPMMAHGLLSNPFTEKEVLNRLFTMTSGSDIDVQLEVLKYLTAQNRPELTKTLAQHYMQVKKNVDFFSKVFAEIETLESDPIGADPLQKPIRFSLSEDLNRIAAFHHFNNDDRKARETYRTAGNVLGSIKAQTLFQSVMSSNDPDVKSSWIEIINQYPHSHQAKVHYINFLIENKDFDEAVRLLKELQDSPEKSWLSYLLSNKDHDQPIPLPISHALFSNDQQDQVQSPGYFVHSPTFGLHKQILRKLARKDAPHHEGINIEINQVDPETVAIARDILMNSGQYDQAIELTAYLDLVEPEDPTHHQQLARLYGLAERWPQAYSAIQQIVKSKTEPSTEDLLLFAKAALQTDHADMAISICQNILKRNENQPEALVLLGEGFWQKGDSVKAIQHLEKVVETIPEEARTWLALARIWQSNGQHDRALDALHKGALAIPDNPEILRELGNHHLIHQSPAEALTYLKKAYEADRENSAGQISLAQACYQLGEFDQAWALLQPYVENYQQRPDTARLLGQVLLGMGHDLKAKPILCFAASQFTDDLETVSAAARLVITEAETTPAENHSEELTQIKTILAKSLKAHSEDFSLKCDFADVTRLTSDHQRALELYSELLEEESFTRSANAWRCQYGMGRSALALGKHEIALAALQEAMSLGSENTIIHHALSEAYAASDLPEKAGEAARTALKLNPASLPNILWYVQFQMENGEPDEAIMALSEALLIAPNHPELQLWLAQSLASVGEIQDSEKNIQNLLENSTASVKTLHKGAYIGLQINQPELAIRALEKAVHLSESVDPLLLMELAGAYLTMNQRRKALETLNLSKEQRLTYPQLALLRADILNQLGQYELALETLNDISGLAEESLAESQTGLDDIARSPLLYTSDFSLKGYFHRLGQLHRISGSLDQAVTFLQRALELDSSDDRAHLAYAETEYIRMNFEQALDIANGASVNHPSNALLELTCLKAEVFLHLERLDEAKALMDSLPTQMKSHPRLLALKSRVAGIQGDMDQCKAYLEQAYQEYTAQEISTSVEDRLAQIMTLNSLAEAAITLQNYALAIQLLQKAVSDTNDQPLFSWRLAAAFLEGAELQRKADILAITTHSPGTQFLSQDNYAQFNQHLEQVKTCLQQEAWLCLNARGVAAFEGEWPLRLNLDHCLNDPISASAVIINSDDDEIVRKALEAHPNHPLVQQAYGLNALRYAKVDGIPAVEKALQADPTDSINHALLAYLNKDNPETALSAIKVALNLWPDESEWHMFAAELEKQAGNQEAASDHIARALSLNPDNSSHWQRSAENKALNNDLVEAKEDLEKSISLQSDDIASWLKLAEINWKLGEKFEAVNNVRKARELDPDNKEIALKEAQLDLDQNRFEDARSKANLILKKDDRNEMALIIYAKSLAKQGHFEEALSTLSKSLDKYPDRPNLSLESLRIKKEMEGIEPILPDLIILAEANPENPEVLTTLTDWLIQSNRIEKAAETAQTILRILPEEARVHLMLGRLQRKSGQLDQAITHFSDAIVYDPCLVEAYLELGKTYQERRELDEAIHAFQQGSKADSSDPRPYFYSGMALKECKDYVGAEKMLRQAKRHAPDDANIIRQLGVVTAMNLINNLREKS